MNYSEYLANGMVSGGKAAAYKNHFIKNIEIIGQRKLAVIGDGKDYELLMSTMSALRTKGVRVPEVAFSVVLNENEADPDNDIKFIDELKGMSKAIYAVIVKPFTPAQTQLAAMAGVVGTSQEAAAALKHICGYTDSDFCQMNDPEGSGLKGKLGENKANGALNSEAKQAANKAAETAAQLSAYKGKMNGERCFILGNPAAKLDELNSLLNERTFAANDFCSLFAKSPQRPSFFLLTTADAYLGNGKYIEGMECFVNTDVTVFEDKFKKKPTYLPHVGNGLIDALPAFRQMQSEWDTAKILPLYEMLQLALYMGFSEIYIHGFDELFSLEYSEGVGRLPQEGKAPSYPSRVRRTLEQVNDYAKANGAKIFTMCETKGLSMFERRDIAEIDFSTSALFKRITE